MSKYYLTFVFIAFGALIESNDLLTHATNTGHNPLRHQHHHDNEAHRKHLPAIWNELSRNHHHQQRLDFQTDIYTDPDDDVDADLAFGGGGGASSNESQNDLLEYPNEVGHNHLDDGAEDMGKDDGDAVASTATKSVPVKCPKCEATRPNVRVSEEEWKQLRIEYVKRQILNKLRLKDKPNVSAVGLPKPIYDGETIKYYDERAKAKDDDYYARTSKKFIFMEQETNECSRCNESPSICFSFKIDDVDMDGIDVNKAVLWVYKRRSSSDALQQTIVVSELEKNNTHKYLPKVKTVAIQSVDPEEGWVKIDIEWQLKHWYGNHDSTHLIHISCQSCEIDSAEGLISTEDVYRPFIEIDTQSRRRHSRHKRSVNCTAGVTECCREKLYISFDEIGWGDWIIQPRGYNAYFCRGSCNTVASIAQAAEPRLQAMRKLVYRSEANGKKPLELIPCCTPKRFSSLRLLISESNSTATIKTFPNMVIDACGCM